MASWARRCAALTVAFCLSPLVMRGQQSRIQGIVNSQETAPLAGNINPLAQASNDQGLVDPGLVMHAITLVLKPSAMQQSALERLLTDQQDRSSVSYHKWLTPEEYGDRFTVSPTDIAKIVSWLKSEGFTIVRVARARNWITFSGTAEQVSKTFRTEIHRYSVVGEMHFANAGDPFIPNALKSVVLGLTGLDDFFPKPPHRTKTLVNASKGVFTNPANTLGNGAHALAPQDLATIYDINPIYQAGIDGVGQSVVVVGATPIQLSDIQNFRSFFGLPSTSPPLIVYGLDAGTSTLDDLTEADLDLEWVGAVAQNATVIYVYAANSFFDAVPYAIDQNLAPVISTSFDICEPYLAPVNFPLGRSYAQQANAQGITWLAASGDSGAAGCDTQGAAQQASHGIAIDHPADIPEVTAVGGTEFDEGSGTYWSTASGEPALSYIPEIAGNDSFLGGGLAASGGGLSMYYPRAPWQANLDIGGSTRAVPDVALTASWDHDPYWIYSGGQWIPIGGTSAATPSFAGIVVLLNQFEGTDGLGNINPDLYRLAQSTTNIFHDITTGNNIVPCVVGSPDCSTGSFGYNAGPGYDLVTGLGSVDAAYLFLNWSKSVNTTTTVTANPGTFALNGTVQLTATVSAGGSTIPTGTVSFVDGAISLGSANLVTHGTAATATVTVSGNLFALGGNTVTAIYSGAAGLNSSSGSTVVTVTQASAVTVVTALTSDTTGIVNNACTTPPQVNNFTTTSPEVWVYFLVNSAQIGDTATLSFYRPDGIVYKSLNSTVSSVGGNGGVCFSDYIDISGTTAASYPGTWAVSAYWDQSNSPLFTLNFTISATTQNSALQIFPHIASDSQWHTDIFVLNPSTSPVTFTLAFHTDSGAPLPLDGNPQTAGVTLPPNGTAFFRTSHATTANEGWAELDSSAPLSGVAVFGRQGTDGGYYEASVPLSSSYSAFTVPFDETASVLGTPFLDAFAVTNSDSINTAQITCTAYDSGGDTLGSGLQVGPLNPLQHTEFLMDQQFGPFLAGKRGTLVCQASTSVGAVELRAFSSSPAVSSMPVIPNGTSANNSTVQVFPHVASDSQWHTDIFILNTNSTSATFTLAFHTDTGAPLLLDGNPQTSNVTLPPNGLAFFRTAPASSANEGWAQLSASSSLFGVEVFGRLGTDGRYYEASTPLSAPYATFTVPFDETPSPLGPPFVDAFAVTNTDPSNTAQITCTAYDDDGDVLGSGFQVGPLGPFQHTEFLIDQQFGLALSGQQGTIACQSGTLVGAVELRAFSSSPAVSSMPVIANVGTIVPAISKEAKLSRRGGISTRRAANPESIGRLE